MILVAIKSFFILFVLLAFYKVVLERESFFATNRIYLISCLLLVFMLPFINLPQLIEKQGFITKMIELDDTQLAKENEIITLSNASEKIDHASGTKPLGSNVYQSNNKYGLNFWLLCIYFFGVVILGLNLVAQVISTIYKAHTNDNKIIDDDHVIVNLSANVEPCSFFKYIFINPSKYDYETYEQILAHEKIHVSKKHSLDLIIAEIVAIIFWFNPFAWLMRNEIIKNIEFETDHLLLKTKPEEKERYLMNLVKIASYTKPLAITTNYNQSLIKNRIIKMNTKKSNPYSYWKYAFVAPVIFALILGLNVPQAIAAEQHYTNADGGTISTKNNLGTNCEDLLHAANENDIDQVKQVLIDFDPSCITDVDEIDLKNIEFARYMVNHKGTVRIDKWNEEIVIEGYRLEIQVDSSQVITTFNTNKKEVRIDATCEDIDTAIQDGDKELVRELMLALEKECIVNSEPEVMASLERQKNYLRNGATINLKKVAVIIGFEELSDD